MKSSWSILVGLVAVTVAAFVYDAHNASSAESQHAGADVATIATR